MDEQDERVQVDYDDHNRRWSVELEGEPCGEFFDTDDDGRIVCNTPSCLLMLEDDGTPDEIEWVNGYYPSHPSIYIEALGKNGTTCVRLSDLKAAIEQFEAHTYKPRTPIGKAPRLIEEA